MESDKKNKACYVPFVCDMNDCCVCESNHSNATITQIPEDLACDLAIIMWEIQQSAKRMQDIMDGINPKLNK